MHHVGAAEKWLVLTVFFAQVGRVGLVDSDRYAALLNVPMVFFAYFCVKMIMRKMVWYLY